MKSLTYKALNTGACPTLLAHYAKLISDPIISSYR